MTSNLNFSTLTARQSQKFATATPLHPAVTTTACSFQINGLSTEITPGHLSGKVGGRLQA